MKLAILRHAGTPDRKLLGLVDEENEAVLRGEWTPETPAGEPELPPDDAPEFQSFVRSAALKHAHAVAVRVRIAKAADEDPEEPDEDGASVILEQPAELYNLLLIGQSPVDRHRSTGAVVHHVQLLPYDHEQVYLDGVVGITILPLPPSESTDVDAGNPVIASYLAARAAQAPRAANDGPRRKMIDR